MKERYSRQILFPEIGEKGQEKISASHVLVLGAGALGSSITEMLVRAGAGKLTLIDRDYVECSNLQRQQLYTEMDAEEKLPKVIAAEQRLKAINSEVIIETHVMDADIQSMEALMVRQQIDLVMDATDNFETRMLINDLSQKYKIPWIYGACVGSIGMSFTIIPGVTPCINCLLKAIPFQGMTCDTGGIISPAVQMTVAHQVAEAMKILVGNVESVRKSYVFFDLWHNAYQSIKVGKVKREDCKSCGTSPTYPFLNVDNVSKAAVLCGRDSVQIRPREEMNLDFVQLSMQLETIGYTVMKNPFLLSAENADERIVFFKDGRALIHGQKDTVKARALYQRILG